MPGSLVVQGQKFLPITAKTLCLWKLAKVHVLVAAVVPPTYWLGL